MRIAYVADIRLPTERAHGLQIMEMCRAFARAGHEVRLFVPTRRNPITATPWEHYGMSPEFEIVRVSTPDFIPFDRLLGRLSSMLNAFLFSRTARRAVRAFAPDVVYMRDPWFTGVDPRAASVLEAHDVPSRITFLHRRAWAAAARIVTVTDGLRRAFREAGVPDSKLAVAHDAVDPETFDVRESRAEARAALGLPADAFIAAYAGHLYPYKGVDDLLDACPRLRPNSRVVFIGGRPDDLARLKARAAEIGVTNATFVGPVPHAQVPLWLRAADAAVLPTRADGRHAAEFLSPLKLFEYLAAGKAIVATSTPSALEVLDATTARLVPPSDPAALADALNALADVPAARESLARAARAAAEGRTWLRRADEVLKGLPDPHPARTWFRRWRTELLIAGVAFALRLAYVLFAPQIPLAGGDGVLYLRIADALRGALPPDAAPTFYQPLYPMFLALVRSVFGDGLVAIRVLQAALSAATVFVTAAAARRHVSPRAGVLAGWIGALWVPAIFESGVVYTETLYAFLLTCALALTLRHLAVPSVRAALQAGLLFAVAGLTREIGLYLALTLTPFLAALRRPRALALVFLLPPLLAAGLMMARNAYVVRGVEVERAPLLAKGYEATLADPEAQRHLLRWTKYPEGLWRFFRLPHRLQAISDGSSSREILLSGDAARILPQLPRLAAKLALTGGHWVVLAFAAYGLWRGRIERGAKLLLAAAIAFTAGTIILSGATRLQGFAFLEPLARYRFPIEPMIVLLAAAGFDRLLRRRGGTGT